MLELPDAWVWDSWFADDGEAYHAFYLKASRALLDPDRRHHRASVGHAVSADLVHWRERPDALVASDGPAFDDLAIWTGSVLADPDGRHHLFYTGIGRARGDRVQRVGHAVSDDLDAFTRVDEEPVAAADPRWYATWSVDGREPWRDPWVVRDGGRWRMLVTAQHAGGDGAWDGCLGTAVSDDLVRWTVEPPLTEPAGLHQLEVPQVARVDGQHVLVWCMHDIDVSPERPEPVGGAPITGTWTAPAEGPAGPFHLDRAEPIRVTGTYAGRVVADRAGGAMLLAFADRDPSGAFGGYLIDPVPLRLTERGTLQPRD